MKDHKAHAEPAQHQPAAAPGHQVFASCGGPVAAQRSALQTQINRSPRMLAQRRTIDAAFGGAIQRQDDELEDEEPLQARIAPVAQRAVLEDDDERPIQGRFSIEGLSLAFAQPQPDNLDEEPSLQVRVDSGQFGTAPAQVEPASADAASTPAQAKPTAVQAESTSTQSEPSSAWVEPVEAPLNLTGMPTQLNALAYAQSNDIHFAPDQEQNLPYEAWHVAQQWQGRVKETVQMAVAGVNDEVGLERDADLMGGRAAGLLQRKSVMDEGGSKSPPGSRKAGSSGVVQRVPTVGNAADYDGGVLNPAPGVAFASVAGSVLTTRANHNPNSAAADPINSNHVRSGHWLGGNYQAGGALALTVAGAEPILNVVRATANGNAIGDPPLNNIVNATRAAAVQAGATAAGIAAAARTAALANNVDPAVAASFYTNVHVAVPTYGTHPTAISVQGGISAGASANQLTRVHIVHHGLGQNTNNNGQNIFWGNPGFNNPQILAEETRMLQFLNGGPQIFNGGGVTLANGYFNAGNANSVVAHHGDWYTPATSTVPAKVGGNIADGLYATINAAFGNANLQYQRVNPNVVPRTGDYRVNVNYNQHRNLNMQAALVGALINEYNNRNNARWTGEDTAPVGASFAPMLAEAQGSISSQVTVIQRHETMAWNPAPLVPAVPNSAIPIRQATVWNGVMRQQPVLDNSAPRFRLRIDYQDANGNAVVGAHHLYDWQ